MTIEYKDSKRIVKLSTDVLNTPTLEDDFSSDDWTDVGSLGVSGGTLGGDGIVDGGDDTSYKDMTSISETAFLFRFKATYITTFGSGSASRFIHFGLSDKFAPQNTTQDFVGFSFEAWNAPAFRIGGQMRNGQTLDQPSNGNLRLSELDHSSAGTFTYWFEVIRNGNAFTLNVYSDSGYSTLVDSVTSTVTGITALRYFSCTNKDASGSSTGTLNVAIDDLKFYNGVSSLTSKPTDVQDNSILVEKDTARRYWFSEALAPTFEDDFTSDNWTDSDSTIIGVNTSTQVLDFKAKDGNFYEVSYIPQTIGDKFVYRMKFNLSTIDQTGNVESVRVGFGLSNAGDIAFTSARDEVGITMRVSSTYNKFYAFTADGAQIPYGGTDFSLTPATSTDYYLEIIGNEGTYTFNIYSDEYSTLIESESITDAGLVLDKLVVRATTSATTNNQVQGIIDDVKFYNGVTSVTPATWTYEYALPTISGLKIHLDASDSTTITKDSSNLVSAWNDKSGQLNHLSQSTGSKQPLWVNDTLNTLPVIRFDGSNDFMNRSTFVNGAISQGFYMFIVMKPSSSGSAGTPYSFDSASGTRGFCYSYISSSAVRYGCGTDVELDSPIPTTHVMYTFFVNGASSNVRKNSTSINSSNLGSSSINGLWLATRYNEENFGNVEFAEFLIYDNDIGTTNRDAVESYLTKKWGLS